MLWTEGYRSNLSANPEAFSFAVEDSFDPLTRASLPLVTKCVRHLLRSKPWDRNRPGEAFRQVAWSGP